MIKVKDRNYYVAETELNLKTLHQDNQGRYIVVDHFGNRLELEEKDYKNLGGK